MEKGIQTPMAQGQSTKSSSRCGGLGPVGCQKKTRSFSLRQRGTFRKGWGGAAAASPGTSSPPSAFTAQCLVFVVECSRFRVQGSGRGFKIQGRGSRSQGWESGCRVGDSPAAYPSRRLPLKRERESSLLTTCWSESTTPTR